MVSGLKTSSRANEDASASTPIARVLTRSASRVGLPPILGNTSSANVVAAAINVALAVDIIAASAAAATMPRIPVGSAVWTTLAKAVFGSASGGNSTLAAIPINAPQTPYITQ